MLDARKLPKTKSVIRIDEVVRACHGKRVLNIGMGGWLDHPDQTDFEMDPSVLSESVHYRLSQVASHLTGTDISSEAIERMKSFLPGTYIQSDLMSPDFPSRINDMFEVVVFGEVLEHLDNMGIALQNIKSVLAPGGYIVLTTPNAFSADRILKMFFNYEACHLEHTAYFSFVTLRRLLAMNDLEMARFDFYVERPAKTRTWPRFALYKGMRTLAFVLPQFSEGLLVIARRAADSVASIRADHEPLTT